MDSVWGNGLREDYPRDNDPCQWRGEKILGEALLAVHGAIRETETESTHPASSINCRFRTRAGKAEIQKTSSAPRPGPSTAASTRKGLASEFSIYFFGDASRRKDVNVLEIVSGVDPGLALSEHDPCLVGDTMTLDDVSFNDKNAKHRGDTVADGSCPSHVCCDG